MGMFFLSSQLRISFISIKYGMRFPDMREVR